MTAPKLYFLPVHKAPPLLLSEEPNRPIRKARLYDANGTEFVGISEVSVQAHYEDLACSQIRIEMKLRPGELARVDAPPPSLADRLRALVAEWRAHWAVVEYQGADKVSAALGGGIEDCADQLEELLDSIDQPPRQEGAPKESP